MAIRTLRPSSLGSSQQNVTVTGGASVQSNTSDDSDSSYVRMAKGSSSQQSWFRTELDSTTLASGERVARYRIRARARSQNYDTAGPNQAKFTVLRGTNLQDGSTLVSYSDDTSFAEVVGPWLSGIFHVESTIDQQAVIDFLYAKAEKAGYRSDDADRAVDVAELYVDLDVWERPDAPTVGPTGSVEAVNVPITVQVADFNYGDAAVHRLQARVFTQAVWDDEDFDFDTSPTVAELTSDVTQMVVATDFEVGVAEDLALDDYHVEARVGKVDVAGEVQWSQWDEAEFTVDPDPPDAPTLSIAVDDEDGVVRATVTLPNNRQPSSIDYDFERIDIERQADGGDWVPLRVSPFTDFGAAERTAIPQYLEPNYVLEDWDAPRDQSLVYRARVVEYFVGGTAIVPSAWTSASAVELESDYTVWMLFPPDFDDVYGDVEVRPDRAMIPTEAVGVYVVLGGTEHVTLRDATVDDDGAPKLARAWRLHVDVWESIHPGLDDLLANWTGTVLIKWAQTGQVYVSIVKRARSDASAIEGAHYVWELDVVEVADGTDV